MRNHRLAQRPSSEVPEMVRGACQAPESAIAVSGKKSSVIWDDLNALAVLNVGTRVRTLRPVVGLALLRVSSVRLGAAHPREILLVSISLPCPCQTLAKFKSLLARLFRHLLNRPVFKC